MLLRHPRPVCVHGALRAQCALCVCPHGRLSCKECNPHRVCPHGRWRHHCPECTHHRPQYRRCAHGKKRSACRECSAHLLCRHGVFRSKCRQCCPSRDRVCAAHGSWARTCRACAQAAFVNALADAAELMEQ